MVTTPHAILFRNASDGAIFYKLTGINQEEEKECVEFCSQCSR